MHWSCFSKGWNSLAANNVKRVTKGGQRCHESMYQVWLWYVKELLRNGLTSCLAALPSSLIGCHGQTVLNFKKLFYTFYTFCQLGPKIKYGKFHEDWTEFVACGYVLLILTTFNMEAKVSMRNNLSAIWGGLTASPDIENKSEIYSCEERGVKTHLH